MCKVDKLTIIIGILKFQTKKIKRAINDESL